MVTRSALLVATVHEKNRKPSRTPPLPPLVSSGPRASACSVSESAKPGISVTCRESGCFNLVVQSGALLSTHVSFCRCRLG